MTYCNVERATIYYEDLGEGLPIVMLHGFTPDHRLMRGCMEPIFRQREGWRRIYLDLPGMGQSKNYARIGSSDDMLQAVSECIQLVLPDQDYILVGESYGGYLSRGLIESQREHVLGAAFICPVVIPEPEKRTIPDHCVVKADTSFLKELSSEERTDFQENSVVLDAYTWSRYQSEVRAGCLIADEIFLEKVKQNYALSFDIDQSRFEKPSIFLLGRQDAVVGYEDALNIIDNYPRATVAILDGAGHNLQIEQATHFNVLISEWLDQVEESLTKSNRNWGQSE